MPLPRLAIVGRPNVGKSSLMNMLASRRVSIVDPTPGVTRDRVSAIIALDAPDNRGEPIEVEVTDTGGYGVYTAEGRRIDDAGMDLAALTKDIERQIASAVESSDLVLFVIDSQTGVTAQDELVAKLLREGGLGKNRRGSPRIQVVANKCDGPRWEAHAIEAAALGFGEPLMVSAKNNYMRRELVDRLYEAVRDLPRDEAASEQTRARDKAEAKPAEMMLAIVGKRNAGKSTLVNTLAGEERVIVSEIAGTTRDAVDVRFEMDGRSLVAIDTAGLRRRKSMNDRVEWYALERMLQAIQRAEVALLMIDATVPLSHVDQQLARALTDAYKPTVIVVNKWDLAAGKPLAAGPDSRTRRAVTPEDYEEYIRKELQGLSFAPIAFMSARRGDNVRETVEMAFELYRQSRERAGTGKLNRLVRSIVESHNPSSSVGKFAKIYYVSQIATSPPTIICIVNFPDMFSTSYTRFLMSRFREVLPFPEVPIKLIIRKRQRDESVPQAEEAAIEELKADPLSNLPLDPRAYFDDAPAGADDGHGADESADDGAEIDSEDGDEVVQKHAAEPTPRPPRKRPDEPAPLRLSGGKRGLGRAPADPTRRRKAGDRSQPQRRTDGRPGARGKSPHNARPGTRRPEERSDQRRAGGAAGKSARKRGAESRPGKGRGGKGPRGNGGRGPKRK